MSIIASSFSRDANSVPITSDGLVETKAITYVTATTGATGATTLFTVTGAVIVKVFGICGTTIEGAGTLEVGISGDTARILAQIADATDLVADEIYLDATPTLQVEALPAQLIISNAQDIIQTIGSTALTAGQIDWYCLWTPLSTDGNVVAA